MNDIVTRLASLRTEMAGCGVDAYYIPTDDFHLSEYVGDYFKCRKYMSGFTGSAGTLVVLQDRAGLWVDSRYFIQAENQLEGSTITMYRLAVEGQPTITEYLKDNLPEGAVVGMDGRCVPAATGCLMASELSAKNISIRSDLDLVGKIWTDRPAISASRAWILEEKYCGQSAAEKLAMVRSAVKEAAADVHILSSLDDIAWLLNIRADDIAFNPVMLAYAAISSDEAELFVDDSRLDSQVKDYLKEMGFTLCPYNDIYDLASRLKSKKVMVSEKRINYAMERLLKDSGNTIIDRENPTTLAKAVKNAAEIENIRRAHVRDGVAVSRFMHWLKTTVKEETLNEISASDYLDNLRYETEGCIGLSFETICAYGEHGAIVHYTADEESCIDLKPEGLLLVDSGGHYLEGTTDITRTFALGELTPEEKRDFTLVLKGMLNLAFVQFPKGTAGVHLDALAKIAMWEHAMNFSHGTGHGVGYMLNVHEGPNNISPVIRKGSLPAALVPGMVTTDEPGLYIKGSHGIRTENELLCVEGEKNEFGQFYKFEILTLAPIDLDALDMSIMSSEDIKRLNAYHERVYRELSPFMDESELTWLKEYTRAI